MTGALGRPIRASTGAVGARACWASAILVVLCLICPVGHARAAQPDYDELFASVVSVLPEWPLDRSRAQEPEGSGVVVLNGKSIITALHVVDRALSIRIRTSSGEIFAAELHGTDRATDLALLTIDRALPPLAFGADARLGQATCAIGNAFGLGLSVTCGTVSAVNRAGVRFNAIEDFVQTDAAVNPGASGGALVDGDGVLIGILSAIFTNTDKLDANIGVNFAVSAPLSKKVAEALLEHGKVAWQFAGLGLAEYPRRGRTGEMAAEIKHVRSGGAGEEAGLKPGDRIVRAGDRRIRGPADFKSILARHGPGDNVALEVRRGEETLNVVLRIESGDDDD